MSKSTDLDISRNYEEAANQYEKEIYVLRRGGVAEYANLSVLYWSFATELFEFALPNNFSETLQELGTKRFKNVLDDGLIKYPESVELNFWKRYYHHRMFFS